MAESYAITAILEAKVDGLVNGFKKATSTVDGFVKKNEKTFDSFKQVGKVATVAGVAVAGGLAFAVKKAAEFESGMSKVAAVSGATGKDLDDLTQTARDWGSATSFSATDAAAGMEKLALAGWDTQQIMGGIGPVLHLAEAGNIALDRSAELVTNSMAGMKLEVKDLEGYLDKVATTAANADTDIDQLMEAFVVAGGTFERLNIPLEESSAMLGIMADNGFKGSEAGTAMNAIMSRLTASTGPAAKELKRMGVNVFDAEGNFRGMETVMMEVSEEMATMTDAERENALTKIAGLNHGKTFNAMLDVTGDKYGELKGEIENSSGALKEMRDIMKDNLQGAMENLSSAFEEIAIAIGTALLPFVKKLAEFAQNLADKFNGLSDETKTLIAVTLAITAAILLVGGGLLLLIGFIPQIIAGFTAVGVVFGAVATAIGAITLPMTLVIAAIIAAAAIVYIYWEPISEFFIMLWGVIRDTGLELWEVLKEAWAVASEWLLSVWEPISEFFVALWETIKVTGLAIWETLKEAWTATSEWFTETWDLVGTFFSDLWTSMKDAFTTAWDAIATKAEEVWEKIDVAVYTIAGVITGLLIPSFVASATSAIVNGAAVIGAWVLMAAQATVNAVKVAAQWVVTSAAATLSATIQAAQAVPRIIGAFVLMATQAAVNAAKVVAQWVVMSVGAAVNAAKHVAQAAIVVGGWVLMGAQSLIQAARMAAAWVIAMGPVAWVTGLVVGLAVLIIANWDKISSKTKEVWTSISTAVSAAWKLVEKYTIDAVVTLGKNIAKMPKKVAEFVGDMKTAGGDLIMGVIKGITGKIGEGLSAIGGFAKSLVARFKKDTATKSPSQAFADVSKWFAPGVVKGIDKTSQLAINSVSTLADNLTNAFDPEVTLDTNGIAGQVNSINAQANRQIQSHLTSEFNVGKQPAIINVHVGNKQIASEIVGDITELQNRSASRRRRLPRN